MWADSLFIWLIWDWIMSMAFNWIRSSLYLTFHYELLLFSFIRDDCVCSDRGEFSCSLLSIQSWPISRLCMVAMLMSGSSFVGCDFFMIDDSLLIIQVVHEKERNLTVWNLSWESKASCLQSIWNNIISIGFQTPSKSDLNLEKSQYDLI